MCSHKQKIEHILKGIFILLLGLLQGWDFGVLGGKNFSVGFAMAPHRLRVLVYLMGNQNIFFIMYPDLVLNN